MRIMGAQCGNCWLTVDQDGLHLEAESIVAEGTVSWEQETDDSGCLAMACNLIMGLVKNLSILGMSLRRLGY